MMIPLNPCNLPSDFYAPTKSYFDQLVFIICDIMTGGGWRGPPAKQIDKRTDKSPSSGVDLYSKWVSG